MPWFIESLNEPLILLDKIVRYREDIMKKIIQLSLSFFNNHDNFKSVYSKLDTLLDWEHDER